MPNYPAIYGIRAALDYLLGVGVDAIADATSDLVQACYDGIRDLPVELLTPNDLDSWAGIIAFRHPKAEQIHQHLLDNDIHIMAHAGRLRVAIHGYNTMADIEHFLEHLHDALNQVG
ncbi:MAG: hypothetical protein CUN54_06150 [Phototrophicales bacterium]|nr:MAG: hypothetical protein CUN54_06150 [Phototrophicales bacterium]